MVDENAHHPLHDLYEVLLHWHHLYLIARIGDVNDRQGGGTGRTLTKCSDQKAPNYLQNARNWDGLYGVEGHLVGNEALISLLLVAK